MGITADVDQVWRDNHVRRQGNSSGLLDIRTQHSKTWLYEKCTCRSIQFFYRHCTNIVREEACWARGIVQVEWGQGLRGVKAKRSTGEHKISGDTIFPESIVTQFNW